MSSVSKEVNKSFSPVIWFEHPLSINHAFPPEEYAYKTNLCSSFRYANLFGSLEVRISHLGHPHTPQLPSVSPNVLDHHLPILNHHGVVNGVVALYERWHILVACVDLRCVLNLVLTLVNINLCATVSHVHQVTKICSFLSKRDGLVIHNLRTICIVSSCVAKSIMNAWKPLNHAIRRVWLEITLWLKVSLSN